MNSLDGTKGTDGTSGTGGMVDCGNERSDGHPSTFIIGSMIFSPLHITLLKDHRLNPGGLFSSLVGGLVALLGSLLLLVLYCTTSDVAQSII